MPFSDLKASVSSTMMLISQYEAKICSSCSRDIKYKDQNGDGVIDEKDEIYLGREVVRTAVYHKYKPYGKME